jgi:DeoR family transcriptional regulator of aga operon
MSNSGDARRGRLGELVAARGFLRVRDAAELLAVSEVTIRGDFTALENAGEVVRVHGGAMPKGGAVPEPTLEQALSLSAEPKRAIGLAAASLVSSGDSVIVDVGSTALAVAEALVARVDLEDVSVITNGLTIALALEAAYPRITVVVTGGTLRPLQHSLVNPGASAFLESLHADLAFIGCNGVDAKRGVTNVNYPEAEVKRRMMLSSKRRVLVADGSKLGQTQLGVIGTVDEFDLLVTSETADDAQLAALRARGLDVLQAPSGQR